MDDERAFFGAIRAAPADPVPRLVYADWLEEHGDADRAEYLRLRTESAGLPSGDPTAARLRRRERALVEGALGHWLLIPGAPVWCLLGGGLDDPVPEPVVQANLASWQRMSGFYDDFTGRLRVYVSTLSPVVYRLAATDAARLFMAGSSLATFVVSTADEYGAVPAVPHVTADMTRDRQVLLNYHTDATVAEFVSCTEDEVMPHLARLLARLWADTRGRPK
jgi:uncharacterized protein (TIGR02996 family)